MKQTTDVSETFNICLSTLQKLQGGRCHSDVVHALTTGDFSALFDGRILHPLTDSSADTFAVDYLSYNLLRKFPQKGRDRKAAAIEAFISAENKCIETNHRMVLMRRENNFSGSDLLNRIRSKIAYVLGTFDWNLMELDFAWGPGATTRLKRKESDVYFKFRGKPETTLLNLPLAAAVIGRIPQWFGAIHPLRMEDLCTVVAGSKITTVPKDAKTDRTIAIEPDMNMYVQKGIGSYIRKRLREFAGVDLNDQTVNQELARQAWKRGLATVDLSSASDSVSYELVKSALPPDWFAGMKQCRSNQYILNSEVARFQKFSTMGNGYTFELESLLFWAIAQVSVEDSMATDRVVSVYGDDIIVHSSAYEHLCTNLRLFGFTVNQDKSYAKGPFYESCGKHFFRGLDVTPVFVKDRITHPLRATWFANSIARWGSRTMEARSSSAFPAWYVAFSHVPVKYRLPIPEGYGDGGVVIVEEGIYGGGSLPQDYCDWLKDPKLFRIRKQSRDYQRGFSFQFYLERELDLSDRNPSDTPYLLRSLYDLERKGHTGYPNWTLSRERQWIHREMDSERNLSIIRIRRMALTYGWALSWPRLSV